MTTEIKTTTPPDLVEAGKVLEGVTPGPWQEITPTDDIWPPRVFAGSTIICMVDNSDMHNSEKRANARFIAWCREGVPALIALATAQAAQIKGLEAALVKINVGEGWAAQIARKALKEAGHEPS